MSLASRPALNPLLHSSLYSSLRSSFHTSFYFSLSSQLPSLRSSLRKNLILLILSVASLVLSISSSAVFAAPKSTGEPGSISRTETDMVYYALEGDTLSSIAQRFTEKTPNWVIIGKVNNITNDRTIPIGSLILIPLDLLPADLVEAKVLAMAGTSTAKLPTGAEENITLGNTYKEGTMITTGKNGFLTLVLPDDSRISIPSNSQVKLSKLRMTKYSKSPRTEITLLQGRVESKVTPLESNKGRFEVRSPLAVAGVRGTHFRVSVNDNGIANEVLSGGVAVGSVKKPNTLVIPAGKGNVVTQQGVGDAVDLLPPPTLVGSYQLQEKPTLVFNLEKSSEAKSYHLQIASDAAIQNVLTEVRSVEDRIKIDGLEDGNYFIRASTIDSVGLEGLPLIQAFTLKARPEPPFNVLPKAKIRAEKVDFVWTEAANAQAYRLQVASDSGFEKIVLDQNNIKTVQYSADKLANGKYYWRVATIAQKNGEPNQGPYSDAKVVDFLPIQKMNPPGDGDANQLTFNWPSEPGQTFVVQIGRDASFSNIYFFRKLDKPELQIPRIAAGDYFIRVRATDADGYVGEYSSPQKFTIDSRWVSSSGEPIKSDGASVKPGF
ncbi:hypothetical protein AAKU64_001824 [Undibacterium sp. GrIS 1.8]|uniref:FecR domain-containing protein n=1 Tax=unclassified Undibacterium TaxID=2630295 RepID=UPI003393D5DD